MIILTFIVLSMLLAIIGSYRYRRLLYIFKPLTMVLIILAVFLSNPVWNLFTYLIIFGLAFSLVGDVFLMLPRDRFIQGLVAFLVAHVLYILAFSLKFTDFHFWLLVPLCIYGAVIFTYLYSALEDFKLPVLIYVCIILTMIWFACAWYLDKGPLTIVIGVLLFGLSDSILAIDRFKVSFKLAQGLILSTYFIAQYLIAGSLT
ncbi:lysoplasmalogenase [Thiotrichales bacterium 19S9-12]|nr:lysoplasmalogenase [Thiotrichales bacterium 19S9-11]MCF6811715.1 lysoplasmalogenase [Thiotrichales bacterium 19S9-12]